MQNIRTNTLTFRNSALALGFAVALLVSALLTWPALDGPFLFDDFPNLEHLATLNGRLDWSSLANYASLYRGEPGRPLSMLSFVINDFNWPSDPWSFKYTNLMLHLLIGVLLFGLARTLARLRTVGIGRPDLIALLTMAAWLLHPMQLSTSMLVVQRMTQLSALFAVVALWAYTVLALRAKKPTTAAAAILTLGIGTVLAVLSKESGALTPLLAVVINATLLRDHLLHTPVLPRRILYLGASVPMLLLLAMILSELDALTGYGSRPFNLIERLLTQSRVVCDYLFNIVVPSLRGGGIYHDDFGISRGLTTPWTTLPATLFVAGLFIGSLLTRRRWPLLAFGLLWYVCGHLLESTIFPLELYFEHRNYLPMFGILFALAAYTVEASDRGRAWPLALAGLWIAFAAWLTSVQAPIWGNKSALASVWAIEHPHSPRAVQQQAASYYELGNEQQAANTLLEGYGRGVRGADFPAQVLLLACLNKDTALAERVAPMISESFASSAYTRSLPMTLAKMRAQVQAGACPDQITGKQWLALTELLLDNQNYSTGEAAAYLHTERGYYYISRRDLNATMVELENAWASSKTPQLAHLISATLASAGLYDEAEIWAKRALEFKTSGIRGWFAQDEAKSRKLLEALEKKSRRAQ